MRHCNDLRRPARARAGFTLIELVVASAIISILMAAVGSAVVIAAKATPAATSAERLTATANQVVQEIARELSQATTITTAAAQSVSFTVPDRTGDAAAETIIYRLNGRALERVTNGGTAVILSDNVKAFNLGYTTGSRTSTTTTAAVEGPEQVLFGCYDTSGVDMDMDTSTLVNQAIRPILPPEATSWRVTKVNLYCKRSGTAAGNLRVQVYKSDASNQPTGSALGSVSVLETLMGSSYGYKTYSFGSMPLLPSEGAVLCISNSTITITVNLGVINLGLGNGTETGCILRTSNAVAEDGLSLSYTTNGSSFTNLYDDAINLEVLGRITATGTATSAIQTIDTADVQLWISGATPVRTTAIIQTRPAYATTPPPTVLDLFKDFVNGLL